MKKSLLIWALVLIVWIGVFTYAALEEAVIDDWVWGWWGGWGGYNVVNWSCWSSKYTCSPWTMEKEKESSTTYRWICKWSGWWTSVSCKLSKSSEVQTLFNRVKTWISNAVKVFEPYKKTDNKDENLTDEERLTMDQWNSIMYYLDQLVPDWAIMAFALDECPTWWTRFEPADGKFLMWANSDIWGIWGDNLMRLSQAQLPSHFHYMIANDKVGSNWFRNNPSVYKDKYLAARWSSSEWSNEDRYDLAASYKYPEYARTSSVWNWELIDITNAHVKVLYCVKISNSDSSNPTPWWNLPKPDRP